LVSSKSGYLFLILIIICFNTSFADDSKLSISGTIFDESNVSLHGANVMLFSSSDSLMINGIESDMDGSFVFRDVKPGSYYLVISHIGYEVYTGGTLQIKERSHNLGYIQLLTNTIEMQEISTESEGPVVRYQAGKTILDVSQMPGVEGETADELLENLPSVSVDDESGVTIRNQKAAIYVDGVRSSMEDALSQIPGGSIESIEVIPNPSAKYDAGKGGVINIKLKKHRKKGLNLRAAISSFSNRDYHLSAAAGGSYKGLNGFVEYFTRKKTKLVDSEMNREYLSPLSYLDQDTDEEKISTNDNIRIGAGYRLSKVRRVSFDLTANQPSKIIMSDVRSDRLDEACQLQHYTVRNQDIDSPVENRLLNFKYDDEFDNGSELSLRLSGAVRDTDRYLNKEKRSYDALGNLKTDAELDSIYTDEENEQLTVNLDYAWPVGEIHRIEFGGKYKNTGYQVDNHYLTFESGSNAWADDPIRSNKFNYDEKLLGTYFLYNFSKGDYDIAVGARIESIKNESNSSDSLKFTNDYDNFLPSIQFTRNISPFKSIQFSYSRRIVPPAFNRLNPYIINTNAYNLRYGNPHLKPEQVDNYELQYAVQSEDHTITAALFYKEIKNIIGNRSELVADSVTHKYPDNLSYGKAIGFDQNWVYRPAESVKLAINWVTFFSEMNVVKKGRETLRKQTTSTFKISASYKWKKRYSFQFIHRYESPRINWQGKALAHYQTDVSAKAYFFDKDISVVLKFTDLFNTQKNERNITFNSGYNSHNLSTFNSQQIQLLLSYKIRYQFK